MVLVLAVHTVATVSATVPFAMIMLRYDCTAYLAVLLHFGWQHVGQTPYIPAILMWFVLTVRNTSTSVSYLQGSREKK